MILSKSAPPLGLAHFTVLEVPPLELLTLAARTGYAFVGLRLHPVFPGAPYYEIPCSSQAMREMQRRINDEGVRVYDIEFVTIAEDFVASRLVTMLESASELGAKRLSVCGGDPDRSRLVASFAALCELAADFGMGVDLECMAWQQVASLPNAVRVVRDAGRSNGGVLVDAFHLSRTGGSLSDLREVAPSLIRSAQLCDAPAERPASQEAIIQKRVQGGYRPAMGSCRCANCWPYFRTTPFSPSRFPWKGWRRLSYGHNRSMLPRRNYSRLACLPVRKPSEHLAT